MHKTLLLLLLCLIGLSFAQINRFKANFQATELQASNLAVIRTYQGVFYYSDTWVSTTGAGHQAMRFDISLNDGTTTRTLTQIWVYQDQFFKYTICGGKCSWQDLFALEPLPKLYYTNGDTASGGTTVVNGATTTPYNYTQNNAVGITYTNFVRLYAASSTPRNPVRAEINYPSTGTVLRLDFSSQDTNFQSTVFDIPSDCPVITPGCFRIDIVFVLDVSGSVGNPGVVAGVQFLIDICSNFLIDAQHVSVAMLSFSYCTTITTHLPFSYNKPFVLSSLTALISPTQTLLSDGWTCIVGGVHRAFQQLPNGRPATRKAIIVVTDGNGNRPCSSTLISASPNEMCEHWSTTVIRGCCPACGTITYSPCNGGLCCQDVHNWQLTSFYNTYYAQWTPTIYAVGVGPDISDATLRLIVNDPVALAQGQPRVFRVSSFFALNSIISALARAILCDIQGSETCPKDCRPGGFCCAGACLCSVDCSLQSSECQQSLCRADNNGARCSLGPPNNSSCEDPRIQCQDRYCVANVGCRGVANDTKPCTDYNLCTNDICNNGSCVSARNNASQCNDGNGCTINDQCFPDGSCKGTPSDTANCTDSNLCTTDRCFNATCISTSSVACTDSDTSDCLVPKCNPKNGKCDPTPIDPGFECAPPPKDDNCTVYVCDRFDPDAYRQCIKNGNGKDCNTGRCRSATRDLDECKSSDINTAGIIGGVIAGVAFIAIIILFIIVLILFLCRKKVVDVLGSFNPFGKDVVLHDNPAHVNPTDRKSVV